MANKSAFIRRALRSVGIGDPHQDLPWVLSSIENAIAASGESDSAQRILAFAQLIGWIRGSSFAPVGSGPKAAHLRFRFLLQLLERHSGPRQAFTRLIASILKDAESPSLFAQTDLNEQGGIFSEIFRRLGDQLLPPPPRPRELGYAVRVAFDGSRDNEWLALISEDEWIRFCAVAETELDLSALEASLRDSVINVSLQASALGLSEETRSRISGASPFLDLSRLAWLWRESLARSDASTLCGSIFACQRAVESAYQAIEAKGVSLSLVYRLENISGLLRRMLLLIETLEPEAEAEAGAEVEIQTDSDLQSKLVPASPNFERRARRLRAKALLEETVRSCLARKSVKALLDMNFDIFTRRLVQHAGETGLHYIGRTRKELWEMLKAGIGGGLVTVLTTLAKFLIYAMHASLFFEGAFIWINYSGSFLAMQFLGFALATKQPSMTSAALADKMSKASDRRQIENFIEEIACISRSQFMAVLGNVGAVIPGALACEFIFEFLFSRPVLSAEQGRHLLQTLHPWESGCLLYAAFTGVLLWLSSFGAGFLQNWAIYRGLPEAIGQSRMLRSALGERRALSFGLWIGRNMSGFGGNLAIGFLLAFVPVAGRFFGLPIDIRHVTLSAGTLAFSVCAVGAAKLGWQTILMYLGTVILIGALNFGVSTACALAVAARARRVRKAWFRAVLSNAWRDFLQRPWRFFWPPADAQGEPASGAPTGH